MVFSLNLLRGQHQANATTRNLLGDVQAIRKFVLWRVHVDERQKDLHDACSHKREQRAGLVVIACTDITWWRHGHDASNQG